MTKKITAWLSSLVLIAVCGSSTAFADDESYKNYTSFQFYGVNSEKTYFGTTSEMEENFLGGTYGKIINDVISVEGRAGLTTESGYENGTILYGGYMRARKRLGGYGFYGLLGYTGFHAYLKDLGSWTESGLSYGAGLELFGTDDLAITLEHIVFYDKTSGDTDYFLTATSLGISYYFGGKEHPFGNSSIRRSGSLRTYE